MHMRHRFRKPPVTVLGMETLRTKPWRFGSSSGYALDRSTSIADLSITWLLFYGEGSGKCSLHDSFLKEGSMQLERHLHLMNHSSVSPNGFKATSHMRQFHLQGKSLVCTDRCFIYTHITLQAEHQHSQEHKDLKARRRGGNKQVPCVCSLFFRARGIRLCFMFLFPEALVYFILGTFMLLPQELNKL